MGFVSTWGFQQRGLWEVVTAPKKMSLGNWCLLEVPVSRCLPQSHQWWLLPSGAAANSCLLPGAEPFCSGTILCWWVGHPGFYSKAMVSVFPFDFSHEKGNLKSLILLLYESQLFLPAESTDRTVLPSWVAYMTFIPGSIRAPAVVSIYKTNSNAKFVISYVWM